MKRTCFITYFLFLFFAWFSKYSNAQENTILPASAYVLEIEPIGGMIVPNYQNYPKSNPLNGILINTGKIHYNSSFSDYFNHPHTGISVSIVNLGNEKVFGYQYFAMPFLSLNTSGTKSNSWWFRFGLGASYFTTFYDSINNSRNKAVGSSYSWAFQAAIHKKWYINEQINLKLGGHYLHASNGHTQLPNFGLNSAALSLALEYLPGKNNLKGVNKPQIEKSRKSYFIQQFSGVGFHELGATDKPIGGPKKPIYFTSISAGFIHNKHFKVRNGFAYRYYQHYYDYVNSNQLEPYIQNPHASASNIYYFVGTEFLFAHVSFDIEGGLNIYKPYFNYFYPTFEGRGNLDFILKKLFCSQVGLNFYAINTNLLPKYNAFVGVQMNANFGQADFSGAKIGFVYRLK
jgi:hypothetical protein